MAYEFSAEHVGRRGTWTSRQHQASGLLRETFVQSFDRSQAPPKHSVAAADANDSASFLAGFGTRKHPLPFGAQGYSALREFSDTTAAAETRAPAQPLDGPHQWLAIHSIPPSGTMTVISFLDTRFGEVEAYYFTLERSSFDAGQQTGARRGVLYVAMRSDFAAQRVVMNGSLVIPMPKGTVLSSGETSLRVSAGWAGHVPAGAWAQLARKREPVSSGVRPGNTSMEHIFNVNARLVERLFGKFWTSTRPQLENSVSVVAPLQDGVLSATAVHGVLRDVAALRPTPWYLSYLFWSTWLLAGILYVLFCYIL
jgi:hypothetical protein